MKDTYHYDSLYIAIIHQACKDLYKLYNTKNRKDKENWELDNLIKWFNDMNLSYLADKIIIDHWKPRNDAYGNNYGSTLIDQLDDYDEQGVI